MPEIRRPRRQTAPSTTRTPAMRDHARTNGSVREELVTVESQRELDLFTGEQVERTFVKLYVAARRSGLLAAISDRDWKTLCTLATYMDAHGYCYPSQAELARAMGCSRQMANERIRNLAAFRFQGQAVLMVVKGARSARGTWSHNGYRVLPLSRLRIYDQAPTTRSSKSEALASTMSSDLDTGSDRHGTMSSQTGTARLDTKKIQPLEPETPLSKIRGEPSGGGGKREAVLRAQLGSTNRESSGTEHIGTVLAHRRQRRPVIQQDEDYQVLQAYIADIAREFGDRAPLKASTTRSYRLFKRAGVSRAVMIDCVFVARAIVRDRNGVPTRNQAAYFFAVLEDVLGLRVDSSSRSSGDAAR
jgi:hypothetical protein